MQVPFSREVAVDEVGDAGVDEEEERGGVLIVQEEVGGCWGGDEARCGEEVGDVVDVLVLGASTTGEGGADGRCGGFGSFLCGFKGGR